MFLSLRPYTKKNGVVTTQFKLDCGAEINKWMLGAEVDDVTQFFDVLDSLDPFSTGSRAHIEQTFEDRLEYSDDLETALWRINGLSSNYMTRMILGGLIGDDPLFGSSRAITPEKMSTARGKGGGGGAGCNTSSWLTPPRELAVESAFWF